MDTSKDNSNMEWYYISLSYATFGIGSVNNIVVKCAPIVKWMIGKPVAYIRKWVEDNKGIIQQIN